MKKLISALMPVVLICCIFCASFSTLAAVGASAWGDVNGDESVDMKDVLFLRKALAGLTALDNERAGDVTFDGSVDMKDVLYLRKFLAHMVDEPECSDVSEESLEESIPTSISSSTTETPPTTTTTLFAPVEKTDPVVLWDGDVNQEVTITKYIGFIDGEIGEEIDAAIREDLEKNGLITGNEYYEIKIDGYSSGPSGYATSGLFVDDGTEFGVQIWSNNKAENVNIVKGERSSYRQVVEASATDKEGKELIPLLDQTTRFALYSDSFYGKDYIQIDHLTITVFRGSSAEKDPNEYLKYYRYNDEGKPVINFRNSADGSTLGTWWWFTDDSDDPTLCNMYLDFLEENGVNEIFYYGYYYLGSSSGKETLHKFVSNANKRGMAVSLIYDDKKSITAAGNTEMTTIADLYLDYVNTYKDDVMNGIHFDVEGVSPQVYADTMISQFAAARERGVKIAMDVNCSLRGSCTLNGVSGIYNVICANVDCISLMSYQDSASGIWNLGATAYAAAMEYGTKVLFGVETGEYSFNDPSVEFAQEDKEYCYTALGQVYYKLLADHPTGGFGVAVHQHRDWYNLKQAKK